MQKINNLKHAWQFILDEGVVTAPSDYNILCYINKLVEEGFYYTAGALRDVPVSIGGTAWKPEIPIEGVVKNDLQEILAIEDVYERAIKAQLYISRGQLFIDGKQEDGNTLREPHPDFQRLRHHRCARGTGARVQEIADCLLRDKRQHRCIRIPFRQLPVETQIKRVNPNVPYPHLRKKGRIAAVLF